MIDKPETNNYNVCTQYQWDEEKDRSNQEKHGVSFEEAASVFEDEYALLLLDWAHSDHEERFIIIGQSVALRVLFVCHCYREQGNTIRIISARKATNLERRFYEKGLPK